MDGSRRRKSGLLWLSVLFTGAAASLEFLWLARSPTREGGMGYVVRRLGLRVELSPAQYEVFAALSALVAIACVVWVFWAARRAVRPAWEDAPRRRPWGLIVGFLLFVICVVPFHHVIGWAAGGVKRLVVLGAVWERRYLFRELAELSAPQLFWSAALVALGAYLLVTPRRWPSGVLARWVGWLGRLPRALLVSVAALVVVALAAGYSVGMLEGQPHFADATVYFFQAKTFAAGRLSSPLIGGREFFDPASCPWPGAASYAFLGERWLGLGLPGAPLFFAVGVLLGCPWIVAPLLGGAVVVATYFLAREVFGPTVALIALPLAALSPWLIFMSGEYLTHVPAALALAVFLVASLRAMARGSWRAAAVAGLLLGIGAGVRPVTAAGFCVPTAVAWVVWLVRRPGQAWRPTLAFALALMVPAAGILAYNAATTGSATTFAYQLAWEAPRAEGTAKDLVEGWRWGPANGLSNLAEMAFRLNSAEFRWPLPGVGFALAALFILGLGGRPGARGPVVVTAVSVVSLALAYGRWASVPMCMGGPRYLFEAAPLVIVLSAGALHAIWQRLAAIHAERAGATLLVILLFCFAYAGAKAFASDRHVHKATTNVDARMFRVVAAQAKRPALVFVPVPPNLRYVCKFYAAIAQNDPALSGPILYARDLGPKNRLLAAARPRRHHYRWDHDTFTLVPIEVDETPPPPAPPRRAGR